MLYDQHDHDLEIQVILYTPPQVPNIFCHGLFEYSKANKFKFTLVETMILII